MTLVHRFKEHDPRCMRAWLLVILNLIKWRNMMKNLDQKLNKKHLSFLAACLCSTIFFNDSPSWGMDLPPEDRENHQRGKRLLEDAEERRAKRQRIADVESSAKDYISQEVKKNYASFLANKGQEIINYAFANHKGSAANMRKILRVAVKTLENIYSKYNAPRISFKESIAHLKQIQKFFIKNNSKIQYDEDQKILSVKVGLIGMRDINEALSLHKEATTINAFALNTFLIDEDFISPGIQFNVIAPYLKRIEGKIIDLTGKEGVAKQDAPENSGGIGGNFYVKAYKIEEFEKLLQAIKVDGGDGGKGRNGLDAPANPDELLEATPTDKKEYKKETDCLPHVEVSITTQSYSLKGTRGTSGGEGGQGGYYLIESSEEQVIEQGHPGRRGQRGKHGKNYEGAYLETIKASPRFHDTSPLGTGTCSLKKWIMEPSHKEQLDRDGPHQAIGEAMEADSLLSEFPLDLLEEYNTYYTTEKDNPYMHHFINEFPNLFEHPDLEDADE
jgi:hypothetical protein